MTLLFTYFIRRAAQLSVVDMFGGDYVVVVMLEVDSLCEHIPLIAAAQRQQQRADRKCKQPLSTSVPFSFQSSAVVS